MADLCTPAHTAFWLIGISRTGEPGTRRRLLSATSMVLPSVTMPGFRAVAGPCGGAGGGVVPGVVMRRQRPWAGAFFAPRFRAGPGGRPRFRSGAAFRPRFGATGGHGVR